MNNSHISSSLWVEWAGESQLQSTPEAGLVEPKGSKKDQPRNIAPNGSAGEEAEAIGRHAQKSGFSRSVLSPVSDH